MRTIQSFFVVLSLVVGSSRLSFAQIDSSNRVDTSDFISPAEMLLEQAPREDGAPIIDLLSGSSEETSKVYLTIRSRLNQSLQRSAGYTYGKYLGSPLKSYQRLSLRLNGNLSGGLLIEKDAGEPILADFYTGNVTLSGLGPFSKIVFGDYLIQAGQGVGLWRGYDYSKGADVITPVNRADRGLVPYLSSGESSFFRGVAMELRIAKLVTTLFCSRASLSGSMDSSGLVTSFGLSGHHRTVREIASKDNIAELCVGLRGLCSFSAGYCLGVTAYGSKFSRPLLLYDGKKFAGAHYSLVAVDFRTSHQSSSVFGEWVWSNNIVGGTTSLLLLPSLSVSLIASFRHYPKQLMSLHGLGFGERPSTSNEDGVYLGITAKPARRLRLSMYWDQFRLTGSSGAMVFPSTGGDMLVHIEFNPMHRVETSVQYQRTTSEKAGVVWNEFSFAQKANVPERRQDFRIEINHRLSSLVYLRGRLEKSFFDSRLTGKQERGTLVYEDILMEPVEGWKWNARLIIFQADSYDSRLYEAERDLDGVLTVPGLSGRGIRWYAFVKRTVCARFAVSAKYSMLIREDVKHVGTGLDELPGNHDTRLGVQIDVTL